MKKRKKIEIITKAITEIGLCRCSFSYSEDFFYYYPNEVNKKFFLGRNYSAPHLEYIDFWAKRRK